MAHSIEIVKRFFKLESSEPEGNGFQGDVDPEVSGIVCGATWLASNMLLLVVRLAPEGHSLETVSDSASAAPDVHVFSYGTDHGLVIIAGVDDTLEGFSLRVGSSRITSAEVERSTCDVSTLVRDNLAGLKPSARMQVMAFMASVLSRVPDADRRLIASIHLMREALRERLPYCETQRDLPQGMHVDALLAVDKESFYVKGWMWDDEDAITRLMAESPVGSRVELLEKVVRYPRTDIVQFYGGTPAGEEDTGFIAYFQTNVPGHLPDGWIFEMHNREGTAWQKKAPAITEDLLTVRNEILGDFDLRKNHADPLLEQHIHPAITTLQKRFQKTVAIEYIDQYGEPHAAADVSIVIPLYKRIDFLEQQLAQFAHDGEVQAADLIYVLDSPELADRLRDYARHLYRLYRIPFRVVTLNRNAGYSTVNNIGASLARGRLLLLLNSDVLPDQPGWLGAMISFYTAQSNIGAMGPKLLYEDDSLQHAGMYFLRQDGETEWENMHFFKGLHRRLPAANVVRPVPAVTGACLLINRHLYQEMGGLQGMYVQGDYEDSDLCLRLIQAGYQNWYYPEAELYHLEGQSYPSGLRRRAQRYNRWLHTRLWKEQIEASMKEHQTPVFTYSS